MQTVIECWISWAGSKWSTVNEAIIEWLNYYLKARYIENNNCYLLKFVKLGCIDITVKECCFFLSSSRYFNLYCC